MAVVTTELPSLSVCRNEQNYTQFPRVFDKHIAPLFPLCKYSQFSKFRPGLSKGNYVNSAITNDPIYVSEVVQALWTFSAPVTSLKTSFETLVI